MAVSRVSVSDEPIWDDQVAVPVEASLAQHWMAQLLASHELPRGLLLTRSSPLGSSWDASNCDPWQCMADSVERCVTISVLATARCSRIEQQDNTMQQDEVKLSAISQVAVSARTETRIRGTAVWNLGQGCIKDMLHIEYMR